MNTSPLLSPVESAARARPLRRWSPTQREALGARFAELHRAWCAAWLSPREGAAHDAQVQVDEPDAAMTPLPQDEAWWSFAAATPAVEALVAEMFGCATAEARSTHDAPLAFALARAAFADWLQRFAALPVDLPAEPRRHSESDAAKDLVNPWSGALCVSWPWCGGIWRLGLPHRVVAALIGAGEVPVSTRTHPDSPIAQLSQALAQEAIALRVMLGGAELNLGQLQALQLGDVIPLGHSLDAPAHVVAADGATLCDGWLGQADGRIAITLALSPTFPSNLPSVKEKNP